MAEHHKLHLRDDNGRHGPYVEVNPADPSDPFALLLEDPEPLTPEDRRAAWESLGELESDGQMERYEATVRQLESERDELFSALLDAGVLVAQHGSEDIVLRVTKALDPGLSRRAKKGATDAD